MIILRNKQKQFSKKDDREIVDKETAERGRKEGVIQRKPNGKWSIISYKANPPRWWTCEEDSKEKCEEILAAYHANKH